MLIVATLVIMLSVVVLGGVMDSPLMLSVMLNVITPNVNLKLSYTECGYADCHRADSRGAVKIISKDDEKIKTLRLIYTSDFRGQICIKLVHFLEYYLYFILENELA